MQQIKLRPDLQIRTRTKVLYDVVNELTQSFLVQNPQSVSEILRKGILEKQYISILHIYLIDNDDRRIAEITIMIDWDLHRLRIKGGKREFSIDPNRSVNEQISEVFPIISRHIYHLKSAFKIKRSEVWFSLKNEISRDEQKYKEAREFVGLGTGTGTPPKWSDNLKVEDQVFLEYVAESLDELRITIFHKRNI